MTKTQTNSRRMPIYRRPITIIITIVLVVGVAVAVFLLLKSTKTPEATDSNPVASNPSTDSSSPTPAEVENPPDKAIQFEGEDPNELEELTGSITRRSVTNGELTVVASIDQYLSSDSSCRLILKDSTGTTVRSTDSLSVDIEATSSACGPFVVSVSQLSGTYTIDITITSPDKSGHIIAEVNL